MLKRQIQDFIIEGRESSKRLCFGFTGEYLGSYIDWAFSRNSLFLVSGESGIIAVGVAYALPKKFDGNIINLLPYDELIDNENDKDICILDWVSINSDGRRSLVSQFKTRFPNWENQDKYGIQTGVIKKLSNKYINLLTLNN